MPAKATSKNQITIPKAIMKLLPRAGLRRLPGASHEPRRLLAKSGRVTI